MNAIATATKSTLDLIDDWGVFEGLQKPCQKDILFKLDCIHRLINTPHKQRGQAKARLAIKHNIGESTISRWLTHFNKGTKDSPAGFQALIDYRSFPKESGLPARFISYVATLYHAQDREDDTTEVCRTLLDHLQLWRETGDPKWEIAGYPHPPKNLPRHNHPRGWSERNILRCRPTKRTRAKTKTGEKDAANHLPFVLTTRVGSAYLSRILFDDQDHDHLVSGGELALSGVTEAVRPVEFAALDFYTACHLHQHLRLEYKDQESGKKKTLTGAEFQWFGIHILQNDGYRTDALGTELIGEHKTAAFWKAKGRTSLGGHHSFSDAITAATNGQVRIDTSGLFNDPALAGMFMRPQSTGNFKYKTWIESSFRLVRTYMQGVIGQTGSHARLNGNDKNYGIQKRESQLLKFVQKQNLCDQQACLLGAIIDEAPDFIKTKLQSSLLSFTEFSQVIQGVYRAINLRTHHKLEGWAECGFTQQLWRPSLESDNWFTETELNNIADPHERKLIIHRINSDRRAYTRTAKLSPLHAKEFSAQADRQHIAKLSDSIVPMLLPVDMAREVTVGSNHTFSLPSHLWPDTRDSYVASIKTRHGNHDLNPGHQLLVFASPFGDGKAHLVDRHTEEYLGTIHSTVRAAAYDHQAKIEQLAARNRLKTALDAPVNVQHRDIAAEEQARELRNTRAMKGEETDPAARRSQTARDAAAKRQENTQRQTTDDAFSDLAETDRETVLPDLQF